MEKLEKRLQKYVEELLQRRPVLKPVKKEIIEGYEIMEECYEKGGKLLIAGNGGSAADAEHIVGELMKGFRLRRACPEGLKQALLEIDEERGKYLSERLQGALPAIALNGHPALSTAYLNDVEGELVYAQQVRGYGKEGDVLLGISTSGNAKNVVYASVAAKALGMKVVGLTGEKGGELAGKADVAVKVPQMETYRIQELHLPVYHCWCLMLEERFFGET